MSENKPTQTGSSDPLASLHRMSTTAGVASQEYVAINLTAVAAMVLGLACAPVLGLASALTSVASVLPLLPIVAVLVGILAIRQIGNSNGTQTGRGLAVVGILAAVVMLGVHGARQYREWSGLRAETALVNNVVAELEKKALAGDYSGISSLFVSGFTEGKKITPAQFATVWETWCTKTPYGKVQSIKTNDRLALESVADGSKIGGTFLVLKFEKEANPARLDVMLRKKDGEWRIADIPKMFPPPPGAEAPQPPAGLTGPTP